jgi:acetylornithine deacetylase/succinyl-diaminopimelate desuccinylase-like protein
MVERHWDRIDCEFLLNEGGTAMLRDGRVVLYGFETAEKVYNDFRLWIPGPSGHSSVPGPKNAIYDAARLLERIESFRMPIRMNETTRASLLGLAEAPEYREAASLLRAAAAGDRAAAEELARNPRFNAQLRSTFVPTMVKGGIRENVLPPDVEINFNARLLPGDSIDVLLRALMSHVGIEKYEVVEGDAAAIEAWKRQKKTVDAAIFLVDRGVDAPVSSTDTEMYRALARTARRLSPGAAVLPRMTTGATDSRFFRARGVQCYGLCPAPTGEEEEKTPHDHNERVRVESVKFGVRFVLEAILDVCR